MKGLLLGAALAIACWLDIGAGVPVQPNFDPQKVTGKEVLYKGFRPNASREYWPLWIPTECFQNQWLYSSVAEKK